MANATSKHNKLAINTSKCGSKIVAAMQRVCPQVM